MASRLCGGLSGILRKGPNGHESRKRRGFPQDLCSCSTHPRSLPDGARPRSANADAGESGKLRPAIGDSVSCRSDGRVRLPGVLSATDHARRARDRSADLGDIAVATQPPSEPEQLGPEHSPWLLISRSSGRAAQGCSHLLRGRSSVGMRRHTGSCGRVIRDC